MIIKPRILAKRNKIKIQDLKSYGYILKYPIVIGGAWIKNFFLKCIQFIII